jgi:hypothetical protein
LWHRSGAYRPGQGAAEPVFVAPPALAWVEAGAPPVAVEPAEEEALGEVGALGVDEGVADVLDEAEGDAVLLGLCEAVEPAEAEEPLWPCARSVTVVVVVTVVGLEGEPALRTGAPAKMPTTMETAKTAMIAAVIPTGLRYLLIRSIRGLTRAVTAAGMSLVFSETTWVSAVGVFGCHRSAASVAEFSSAP